MTEQEIMQNFLEWAKANCMPLWSSQWKVHFYEVDIRGTITWDEHMESILIDFHDLHAYWAPNRKVTYCEGGQEELEKHWSMNDMPLAIAIYCV